MRTIKWAVTIIGTFFLTLVLLENAQFLFKTPHSLKLDLFIDGWCYQTHKLPIIVFLAVFFCAGFLMGIVLALPTRLRAKATLKKSEKEIQRLSTELYALKNRPAPKFSLESETAGGQEKSEKQESPADAT